MQNKVGQQNKEIIREVNNIADMTGRISGTLNNITSARSNSSNNFGGMGDSSNNITPIKKDINMNSIKVMKPSPQYDDNNYGNYGGGGGSMMNQNKVSRLPNTHGC